MADPVAWKVIEHGWEVVGPDGDELGNVHEVLGDPDADIFNGLTLQGGLLGKPSYVPSERVAEIVEGRITLDVGKDRLEALDAQAPPAAE